MNPDWIAGFVDGDGCFYMQVDVYERRHRTSDSRWFAVKPLIHITQCRLRILREIRAFLGFGMLSVQNPRVVKGKRFRPVYGLRIDGWKSVSQFLDIVGDHIILKQKQVELLRRACGLRGDARQGQPIPPNKLLGLIDLAVQLRKLNYGDPARTLARLENARRMALIECARELERPVHGTMRHAKGTHLVRGFVNPCMSGKETKDSWLRVLSHLPDEDRERLCTYNEAHLFSTHPWSS
jgi:hypothetical protein